MTAKTGSCAIEIADGVGLITLNNPDNLNAFNPDMFFSLMDALETAEADERVRAVVVTGAGRVFCAGADLKSSVKDGDWDEVQPLHDGVPRDGGGILTLKLFEYRKPIIAAINGAAVGVGMTMTLPMDIRIASETAKFSVPFARRALCCESACSWFLPRIVGVPKALEWTLRGHMISASEAREAGLVSELVEGSVLDRAMEIAKDIARNCSPRSMAQIKQLYSAGVRGNDPFAAHIAESRLLNADFKTNDFEEAVQAFFEKRSPNFGPLDTAETASPADGA